MKDLPGQVAVVTGGGGGIGSAICRRLAEAGAQIVITYNSDQGKARATANSLAGANHFIIHCPVDDSARQAQLAQAIEEKYGRLDILVNNAGISKAVPHHDLAALDDETIDRIFRVNWRGAFASIRALQALLMAGAGGVVVNISSIAGRTGVGSNVAYCASKAAMDSMTRSLAAGFGARRFACSQSRRAWSMANMPSACRRPSLPSKRKRRRWGASPKPMKWRRRFMRRWRICASAPATSSRSMAGDH